LISRTTGDNDRSNDKLHSVYTILDTDTDAMIDNHTAY